MKKNSILRGLLILMFLLISAVSFAKVRVTGNVTVWFDTTSRTSNNKPKRYVGNMNDRSFEERAFVINNRGYSFLRDNNGNKLLLRVIFDTNGYVLREDLFETYKFTQNCLSVKGDDNYCFTITSDGYPSIWDRYQSKYIYYGKFLNNVRINNPFNSRNYYDDKDYFDPLFEF